MWTCFLLSILTAYAVRVDIVTWEESILLWGISIVGILFVCISERKD